MTHGAHDSRPGGERAPWEIGGPQPALRDIAIAGGFTGRVLDSGCGSGEHALLAAEMGLDVVGIDIDESALAAARRSAAARGVQARFFAFDALRLADPSEEVNPDEGWRHGDPFDTVIDSELFHSFDGRDRERYVAGLHSVLRPGGRLFVLCFSDAQQDVPHRIRRDDLVEVFDVGWSIASIEPVRVATTRHPAGASGWLATVVRLPEAQYRLRGEAPTDRPARYIQQLADHVEAQRHRAPHGAGGSHVPAHIDGPVPRTAEQSNLGAMLTFDVGGAALTATRGAVLVDLTADTPDDLESLRASLSDRMEVIGRRDGLAVTWR